MATDSPTATPGKNDSHAGPAGCPNCHSTEPWGRGSWCPQCGFYPALGTCVAAAVKPAEETVEAPRSVWSRIPQWTWILGGGVVAVWFLSLCGRLLTSDEGPYRCLWAVVQLTLGAILFAIGHFTAYFFAIMKSDKIGPMAIVFHPVEIWEWTVRLLPKNAWRVWTATWGACAILCALLIVGGISYAALFERDWGFRQPPKKSVVQALVEQARNTQGGNTSMEEAMNDFVGEAGAKSLSDTKQDDARKAKLPIAECLIVGYTKHATGDLDQFVLASVVNEKVRFAGTLPSDTMPPEIRQALISRLESLKRDRPFLKTPIAAHWLQPVLMCEVSYKEWTDTLRLRDPQFKAMLNDLKAD